MSLMYPLHINPNYWKSCEDSIELRWQDSVNQNYGAIRGNDRAKLYKSVGYCPHRRHQLSNVTDASISGGCPSGLCYTKLKNGNPSSGTCCFTNGEFLSGKIIGYYNKSQPTAKAIYKTNVVSLGGENNGNLYDSFISANEVYPHIILTQCPLRSTASTVNTINDIKRMILERNISLWVQVAPDSHAGVMPIVRDNSKNSCPVFPLEFFANTSSIYHTGVSNFREIRNTTLPYVQFQYDLSGYVLVDAAGVSHVQFTPPTITSSDIVSMNESPMVRDEVVDRTVACVDGSGVECTSSASLLSQQQISSAVEDASEGTLTYATADSDGWVKRTVTVQHFWYFNWVDFSPPLPQDTQAILHLSNIASEVVEKGGTVAVNCLSGRGRSGTFVALTVAKLEQAKNTSALVDIIVGLRESRDSVVETPEQFMFIVNALQLPFPQNQTITVPTKTKYTSASSCNDLTCIIFPNNTIIGMYFFFFFIGVLFCSLFEFYRLRRQKNTSYLMCPSAGPTESMSLLSNHQETIIKS